MTSTMNGGRCFGYARVSTKAQSLGAQKAELIAAGCEVRHLRAWRTSAEREISLFEQLAGPRLRHRDPGVRAESVRRAAELAGLGAALRSALVDEGIDALGQH